MDLVQLFQIVMDIEYSRDIIYIMYLPTDVHSSYSVHLARKVLKLERINTSLQQQLEAENKDKWELKEKVSKLIIYIVILCGHLEHKFIKELISFQRLILLENRL